MRATIHLTLMLMLIPIAALQALAEEKQSHFVEALEPTRALPKGVELAAVSHLLNRKIRLRMDIEGEALPGKTDLTGVYAAAALEAGKPVLQSAVTKGVPPTLADLVPPNRTLLTLEYPAEQLAALRICSPYDKVALAAGIDPHAIPVTEEARLVSHAAPAEQGQTAILVLALKEEAKQRLLQLVSGRAGAPNLRCLKAGKYE